MRVRDSAVSGAVALLTVLAAACATSGGDNEHGPAFTDAATEAGAQEAGGDATADTGPAEGGFDASTDRSAQDGPTDGAMQEASDVVDAPVEAEASTSGDAGTDAGEASAPCTSTMALLAGGSTAIAQATYGHGQWSTATVVTGGAAAAPSLVAFGTGYLGAFVGAGTVGALPLKSTAFTGSWSPPVSVAAALGQGVPALAVTGASAHVVYWGSDDKYYHGTYTGSWDAASDPVGGAGASQSFGPSAPAAAGVGTDVVVAQSGSNGSLYDQVWSGTWAAATPHAGSSVVGDLTPAIVALDGGTADAMIVFVHAGDAGDYHLQSTVRTSGTWSAPADVFDQSGNIAYAGTTPSLAALPGGGAVLAWLGSSPAYAYVSTYGASGWTAPMAVSADVLAAPPSVATGVCGATAAIAYATTAGTVSVVTLAGGTWTTPAVIAGATGMASAAIATSP
jgi:hypothetical protein